MRLPSGSPRRKHGRKSALLSPNRRKLSRPPAVSSQRPAACKSCPAPAASLRASFSASRGRRRGRAISFCQASWRHRCRPVLSGYRFRRYKANGGDVPRLCLPDGVDGGRVERIAWAVALGRDLINTPANDMDPDGLEEAVMSLAARHHAKVAVTRGDQPLEANLPLIHAAGRAAEKPPRLADFSLGDESKPKVSDLGRGVCFDSGGLDI